MRISNKTLIALGKWKMLIVSCPEGETEVKVDEKQYARLRQTISRERNWKTDKEFEYSCKKKYNSDLAVIIKTRRVQP